MDAFDFLKKKDPPVQPIYVITGDEEFLRRQVRAALETRLVEDADPAFAVTTHDGNVSEYSTVKSELDTIPFLGPRRVVIVEQADEFVSSHRPLLEKLVAHPSKGTLILEVKSWPSNTKLAKAIPESATIVCKTPHPSAVPGWCAGRAALLGKQLGKSAAGMLCELVGPSLGLLDQEIAKLAAYVGDRDAIEEEDIDHLVGRSRAAETFKMFDAIGDGHADAALAILHRLFEQGEEPMMILGAFSWQLRRLAQASRLAKQGMPIRQALQEAGVRPFALANWEKLMKHLGWRRLDKLYDWLLEVDLGIKGGVPLPERIQLERLLVKLAQPREPTSRPRSATAR